MGIAWRKKKPVKPAEEESPTFGQVRANPYTNSSGDIILPDRYSNILPSRHEIVDPYAHAPALEAAQMLSQHTYTPDSRAVAMLKKTTAVTIALALLTGAAMIVFVDDFLFFWWLLIASAEWVGCFVLLAILDFRETPAAHVRQKTAIFGDLMKREQRARLKSLYGYDGD
jgi:hypothetical protein